MKKNKLIFIIALLICTIIGIYFLFFVAKEYPDDNNTLYSIKFGREKLRFERIDTAIGQKQVVVVQKSTNNGKTFDTVTKQPIILSMEPKFIFLNSTFGIVISTPYISESNNYMGIYVTHDGGESFIDAKIMHYNPYVEKYEISGLPYFKNNNIYLPCLFHDVKEDLSGYENIKTYFISNDYGLTWSLHQSDNMVSLLLEKNTISSSSATFYLNNNTDGEYIYNSEYYISRKENDKWIDIDLKPDFTWNNSTYELKSKQQHEININWSLAYGELDDGEYRIVKNIYKNVDTSSNNKILIVYSYFEIK